MSHARRGGRRGRGSGSEDGGGVQRKPMEESLLLAKMKPETIEMFRCIQGELDKKHDKHERMVKLSRDLTIEGKRVIFLLHRITTASDKDQVIAEAEERLNRARLDLCCPLSKELQNEDVHQFIRAYGFGLQEYIEACTLLKFIKDKQYYDYDEACSVLDFPVEEGEKRETVLEGEGGGESCKVKYQDKHIILPLLLSDYLLGVADASGELMRLSINSVSAQDQDTPPLILHYLQIMHANYAALGTHYSKEATSKLRLIKQCMEKVEKAMYILKLRKSEMRDDLLLDILSDEPQEANERYD